MGVGAEETVDGDDLLVEGSAVIGVNVVVQEDLESHRAVAPRVERRVVVRKSRLVCILVS